jgi:hypothetical protein
MDEPKKKILEMVASGKISVEEAAALLDKVDDIAMGPRQLEAPDAEQEDAGPSAVKPEVPTHAKPRRPHYLRVQVESSAGDEVNVRLPFNLIKAGIKLSSLLPRQASEAIDRSGVDLSRLAELEGDELLEALAELQVHVESSDGDEVHVYCE